VGHPEFPPAGTVVGTLAATWSDGAPFTGSFEFDASQPKGGNEGGIFAIVNNADHTGQLIVDPNGPGVGMVAVLDRVFVRAVQ
jgi:hypothetical protein